ncbi:MAG: class I SAM-dependent methyltransferase [Paenibacillus sp.]|uniref:class I SAM-dependent DNA methyltransferase n=1 Tax=Paenibacillus sp. TaxID=58172 RepID=UPI00290C4DC4|nr:class I SAM-dependent methyltransferase [Paenibacillus sp.]MDU4695589.1 class I SAM-dependent methyltransferase [Paenibacillus sp.]
MSTFNEYAKFYDLLYQDKDYSTEVDYIDGLIKKFSPEANSILELGCGTGKHAMLLAQKGYNIHGVDISSEMLRQAELEIEKHKMSDRINLSHGDIRDIRINQKYDVVISLFHVMSYQTMNADIERAFLTASHHLKPNGIFIFDCWYGPGVLTDPPVTRVKRYSNDQFGITRIAEPEMNTITNTVTVKYELFVKEFKSNRIQEIQESHVMRYFFKQEIELLFEKSGLNYTKLFAFLKKIPPTTNDWNSLFIGTKKG